MKKIMITGFALFLLAACGMDTIKDNEGTQPVAVDNTVNEPATNGTSGDVANPAVSMREAAEAFLKAYPDAKIESIDLDADFGRLRYEIEAFDSAKDYEVEIDATTKVLNVKEVEANRDREEALDLSSVIEPKEAIEKASAQNEAKGFSPKGWTLEAELGKPVYTIEYKKGLKELEIKVDATTGEILEADMDD